MIAGCLLINMAFANPEPTQTLFYDLSIKGLTVGHREVKITYIPASDTSPLGSRRIESYTELKTSIHGQDVEYIQRATTQLSEQSSKTFVSSISLNENLTELQGRQKRDGSWIVHQITPAGVVKKNYSRSGLHAFSLELFDPGQHSRWEKGDRLRLFPIELGELDIWEGVWTSDGSHQLTNSYESISGSQLTIDMDSGAFEALWSHHGVLIDWSLRIGGIRIDADIRNIPKAPEFGEITPVKSFGGVKEEEL